MEQAASTVAMLLFYALLVLALAMLLALTMSPGVQSTRSEAHQLAPSADRAVISICQCYLPFLARLSLQTHRQRNPSSRTMRVRTTFLRSQRQMLWGTRQKQCERQMGMLFGEQRQLLVLA